MLSWGHDNPEPAMHHGRSGTIRFADGRAEVWHWREAKMILISGLTTAWLCLQRTVANTDRDLSRFFQGMPEKVPIR